MHSSPPSQYEFGTDANVVVLMASFLCALITLLGLALVARCACVRITRVSSLSAFVPPPSVPNKGVDKRVVESIPKLAFAAASDKLCSSSCSECVICLGDFEGGDQIRILPQCRHGFHACCIDTWLGSHSSCPSCRQVLVEPAPPACTKCGAKAVATSAAVVVDMPLT